MEELLAQLVALPTVTDDVEANSKALDFVAQYLEERGMYINRYIFQEHGCLVATIKPGIRQTKAILYGHIDVVPASKDLFTLRRNGDKLFGRGTYDMKFAIAGYLHLVDTLKDQLSNYDFAIMITTDEEYGGRDEINCTPHLLAEGYRAEICVMPDGGREWNVETIAKGKWCFRLVATGRSAHSSRPWEGESASFKLIQALNELREVFKDHGPDTDTLNIGQINGDGTYSQIPSDMSAQVEIRLVSEDSLKINRAIIENLCKKHDITKTERSLDRPLRQDTNNPLIRSFMDSITRITGHQSRPCISMGASDAEYFNAVGIPCAITYLPGGGHHGEHEWVSYEALELFPKVIHDYLEQNAHT